MTSSFQRQPNTLSTYIILGVAITLTAGLFLLFIHVVLWGMLLGSILWVWAYIKRYFASTQTVQKNSGRIIDHDTQK